MRIVRHDRPDTFLEAAGDALLADEGRHHLVLSIARTCRDDPERYGARNYFAVVEEGGRVAGAAVMTPPHQLLCHAPPGAAGLLAEDLDDGGWKPTGAHGPVECVDVFAAAWTLPRGLRAVAFRELRGFALERVIPAPPASGAMRAAVEGDLDVAEEFHAGFRREAEPQAVSQTPREAASRSIGAGRLFLWVDGDRAVSQAAISGTSPTGARIGAVYTPPEDRCRGYATALVGALSARALSNGRKRCYLFTDLANPVSNSIYPRVGYRPVADYREWTW